MRAILGAMARLRRIEIAMVAFIAAAALLPAGNAAAAPPTWAFRGGLIAILEDNAGKAGQHEGCGRAQRPG